MVKGLIMEEGYGVISKDEALFHARKHMTFMFKQFLILLEDLRFEHDNAINKLKKALPTEYTNSVDLADYFNEDLFQRKRKRILDFGNQIIKNCSQDIDQTNN
jgi:hypothetical protein